MDNNNVMCVYSLFKLCDGWVELRNDDLLDFSSFIPKALWDEARLPIENPSGLHKEQQHGLGVDCRMYF